MEEKNENFQKIVHNNISICKFILPLFSNNTFFSKE